jgi:hypothetical protein
VWLHAEDVEHVAGRRVVLTSHGYPAVMLTGRRVLLHRLILGLDDIRSPLLGDHLTGDPLDARGCVLRAVGPDINAQNRRPVSTSGHRGVTRQGRRWRARAGAAGRHWLGSHPTPEDAATAAAAWRRQHMPGDVDRGRLPGPPDVAADCGCPAEQPQFAQVTGTDPTQPS